MSTPLPSPSDPPASVISVRGMDFSYGPKKALSDINLEVPPHQVTAFIGPSGCGKSTLLRCFNRMNDMVHAARVTKGAALWDETKDRLQESALGLSGGQQQRLCIARAIAVSPEIILMDEPCSALDPIATLRIEELIHHLRARFTIVIVTHNMQQATRCADRTAFFYLGELIEYGQTGNIFNTPREKQTEAYISGLFS